jgi:hypothetical protein
MTVDISSIPATTDTPEKRLAVKVINVVALVHRKYVNELDYCKARLAKFKENIDKDPAHAFEWSNEYFQVAANYKVASIIVGCMEGTGFELRSLQDHLLGFVLHGARYPSQSTSPTSNLYEQCKLAAFTEAYRTLSGYLEGLE